MSNFDINVDRQTDYIQANGKGTPVSQSQEVREMFHAMQLMVV